MGTAEILRLVGKNALAGSHGDLLTLRTAPRPSPVLDSYQLVVSPDDGVVRVDGRARVDAVGGELFHSFLALRDATTAIYGSPDYNIVKTGNYSASWDLQSILPGGIDAVVLLAGSPSPDRSAATVSLLLSYECTGFDAYLASKKAVAPMH